MLFFVLFSEPVATANGFSAAVIVAVRQMISVFRLFPQLWTLLSDLGINPVIPNKCNQTTEVCKTISLHLM